VSVFFGNRCYLKNSSVSLSRSSNHLACKPQVGKDRPDPKAQLLKAASCSRYGCGARFSSSQSCQCDRGCNTHGNCCYDYAGQCSSSATKGEGGSNTSIRVNSVTCAAYGCSYYRSGNPCQCNAKCARYDNCCHDYKASCKNSTTLSASPEAGVAVAAPTAAGVTAAATTTAAAAAKTATVHMPAGTTAKVTATTEASGTSVSSAATHPMADTSVPSSARFTTSQTDSWHTSDAPQEAADQKLSGCHSVVGRFLLSCSAAGLRSSGDEKNGQGSRHGRNSGIAVVKKFLQTASNLDKGREAFRGAPSWIALPLLVAVFTTLVIRVRRQLCLTRAQDEAEAEQLLQLTGNVWEQRRSDAPLLRLYA